MIKIYLARHGQDEDNAKGILNGRRDSPLTNLGVKQAGLLAEKIRDLNLGIKKVYSSPLQRAYKTAETVSDMLGLLKPEKLDISIERDFGNMTGKAVKDIESLRAPNIIKSDPIVYFLCPDGAETFPELIERAKKILILLNKENIEGPILLVTHGDIGKMIYAVFYKLDWKDVLTDFHFGNSEVLLLLKDSKPNERHVHKTEQFNH